MPPDPPDAPTDTSSRPVRADVTTTATAGGVLVAVTLRNDTAVDVRVRVENDLDGPVLPPRREGVPAAGWDEDGFTGTVPANARLGVGYACPIAGGSATGGTLSDPNPAPDPISLEILGPADEDEQSEPDHVADAVRSLGRATPPADAVPTVATADSDDADVPTADHRHRRCGESVGSVSPDVPTPVAAWLDAVETRIRRAERLDDPTADEAATVLEDCGGVDAVATLPGDLDRDLETLRAVGDRIEELAARAAAADPDPVVSSLVTAADEETTAAEDAGGTATARRSNGTGGSRFGRTR